MGKLAFSSDVRLFFSKRQPLVLPPLFLGVRRQLSAFCRFGVPRYVSWTRYQNRSEALLADTDTTPANVVVSSLARYRIKKECQKLPFSLRKLRHCLTSFHCVIICLLGLSNLPCPIGLALGQQKKRQTKIGLPLQIGRIILLKMSMG